MAEHVCGGYLPTPDGSGVGAAIMRCYGQDGALFVANDEYASQVNYCPYCGYAALKQVGALSRDDYQRQLFAGHGVVWEERFHG